MSIVTTIVCMREVNLAFWLWHHLRSLYTISVDYLMNMNIKITKTISISSNRVRQLQKDDALLNPHASSCRGISISSIQRRCTLTIPGLSR